MARIPTRFDLSMTPAGRFLQLQQPQMPSGPAMSTLTARPAAGGQPVTRGTSPMALAQQAQLPAYGLRAAAMRGPQTAMGATPPKKPMSLMERLSPELGTPASAGLGAAAATGLQLSGYSPTPISTAQGLGAMMQSGMKAFQAAKAAETAEKRAALQDRIAMAKLGKESALMEKLRLAGIDPSSPEGQEFIRNMLTKPATAINLGDGKRKEMLLKSAMDERKIYRAEAKLDPAVDARLNQAIDLLETGVETGSVENLLLPLKKLGLGMGLIGDDEADTLSAQEMLKSIGDQLAPMMRVTGSGSSSDKDVELFRSATIGLEKSPYTNLIIAKTIRQTTRHNKARLALLDKYIEDKGTTLGFGDFADSKLPPIYYRVSSDDDLQTLYDDGKVASGDVYWDADFGKFAFVEIED